jgi:hypothetical protein
MNTSESTYLLKRMASTWPQSGKLDDAAFAEWTEFLADYQPSPGWQALSILRESCTWRPSMADFRSAYYQALAFADDERKQLPAAHHDESDDSLQDRYGASMEHWNYCWRCDMAISLDDLENRRAYDGTRGLHHRSCPRRGSAPQIPAVEKSKRDKWFTDHKISVGPNTDPVRYVEATPRRRRGFRDFDEVSRHASAYLAKHGRSKNPEGTTP